MTIDWRARALLLNLSLGLIGISRALLLRSEEPECLPLYLDDPYAPSHITISITDNTKVVRIKDPDKYKMGDIIVGDLVVFGDCSYKSRHVILDVNSSGCGVLRVITTNGDTSTSIEEFVELVPLIRRFTKLVRSALHINLNTDVILPMLALTHDPEYSAYVHSVQPLYKNDAYIGSIHFGDIVFLNRPCISRTVTGRRRRDGRVVVFIQSYYNNDKHETVVFIQIDPVVNRFKRLLTNNAWGNKPSIMDDLDMPFDKIREHLNL